MKSTGPAGWRGAVLVAVTIAGMLMTGWAGPVAAGSAGPLGDSPRLLAPPSGATLAPGDALSWAPDPLADEYTVVISETPDFQPGRGRSASTTRTAFVPWGMGPGTYWWRVQSWHVGSTGGDISTTRSFTVRPTLTTAPVLAAPVDGAMLTYPTSALVLRWTPVAAANSYEVQFATDSGFTANVTSFPAPAAQALPLAWASLMGVPVHWRVRPMRGDEELGPWSAPRTYTLAWTDAPVAAPDPPGPVTLALAQWTPVAGARNYRVEWTTVADPAFAAAQAIVRERPYAWLPAGAGSTVIWRVRGAAEAADIGALTPWSAVRTAIVAADGTTPDEPAPIDIAQVTLAGPADDATLVSGGDTVLGWEPVTGAIGYQVQVARVAVDFDNVNPLLTTPGIATALGPWFEGGIPYKWRVRAIGPDEVAGAWSETRRVSWTARGGVTLVTPADGETVQASQLRLSWAGEELAPGRVLELSRTPDFAAATRIDASGPARDGAGAAPVGAEASAAGPPVALPGDVQLPGLQHGTWYWRVMSVGYPVIARSETRSFSVVDDTPPMGMASLDGGASKINEGAATFGLDTEHADANGVVTTVHISLDGSTWTAYPSLSSVFGISLPTIADLPGWTGPGRRDVWVTWEDDSGNQSDPVHLTTWYAVDPPVAPEPPSGVTAVAGDGRATVSWRAPLVTGGSPITGYLVDVGPEGAGCATTGATTCVVTGLTNGSAYTFRVRSSNAARSSELSEPAAVATPRSGVPRPSPLAPFQRVTSFTVGWTPAAGATSVPRYDVRYRVARPGSGYGAYVTWRTATTARSATFGGSAGRRYCISVRARDPGAVSAWSAETCTAVPIDDRSLERSRGWDVRSGAADFAGTNLRSARAGATLTRTSLAARRIAVLVTTCPSCGSIRVYWRGSLVRTISLASPAVVHRRLITVASFGAVQTGTLVVAVAPGGRPVVIDGIVAGR